MSRERAQKILTDNFGPFGPIKFPYVKMGKIDSLHLFGLHTELAILAMYIHNKRKWRKVLDIGANLGLHSICMARMGMTVLAYEPDPEHYKRLIDNLVANRVSGYVTAHQQAVHTCSGTAPFIRVLDNLTGNHIVGYKDSYGPKAEITVEMVDCKQLWPWADFAKIDSEGNEAELCMTMTAEHMAHLQCVMEVRNRNNAHIIYDHFRSLKVPMWSQKVDWKQVKHFSDMPKVNREGSLFVGYEGPWN